MSIRKNSLSSSHKLLYNFSIFNKSALVLSLLSVTLTIAFVFEEPSVAEASLNLDDFIQQTQENIQSAIESSESNSNSNNECNNNISIQSQTNENGKTTSTTRNICDGESTTTSTSSSGATNILTTSGNLSGSIVSSEYDQTSGIITYSIFGNWSLITKSNGAKDFNANFIKQPINENTSESLANVTNSSSTIQSQSNASDSVILPSDTTSILQPSSENVNKNVTLYTLNNFIVSSTQQQNNDITYSGKMDIIQEIQSSDPNTPDELNTFKGIGASVSIVNSKVLIITFDSQSLIAQEFSNIPLVGLIK